MQQHAASLKPVIHKDRLQLRHDRTFNTVVSIAPMLRRLAVAGPLIGNSHAADESGRAIYDEKLSVSAVVVAAQVPPEQSMVLLGLNPGAFHERKVLLSHFVCALGIENDVDFHAGARSFSKRLGKL